MFKKLIDFSEYIIDRTGTIRHVQNGKPIITRTHPSGQKYVTFQRGEKYLSRNINVLLVETFGPGAAAAAGFSQPDMKRVKIQRELAKRPRTGKSLGKYANPNRHRRKCHDCGKPTSQYRCNSCWRKLRGFGFGEAKEHHCDA